MSRHKLTPLTTRSNSSGSLARSVPTYSSFEEAEKGQGLGHTHSLVGPVIDEEDLLTASVGSSSSVNVHRKEAARLIGSSPPGHSVDFDDLEATFEVINPEDTHKRDDHQTSFFQTLLHLVEGNMGIDLLALPLAVKNAGLAVGGVSLILLGIIATHCMLMLVDVAHTLTSRHPQFKTLNYAQAAMVAVAEHTHNKTIVKVVGVVVNISLIFTQFGFCCLYFVFIADNLNQVFCSAFGSSLGAKELEAVHGWIGIIIIPLIIVCWIKNVDSLTSFSMIANLCIAFSLSVILYEEIYSFVHVTDPKTQAAVLRPKHVNDSSGNPGGIYMVPRQFIGVALFCRKAFYSFEGIGMVLPLENKMAKPWLFKRMVYLSMLIVISLHVFVSILGYAVYGDGIQRSIIFNLEESYDRVGASIVFLVAKLSFAYAMFGLFMLQFYAPMDILEPPLNRAINKVKERYYLVYRFPQHHHIVNTALLLTFRTVIVALIGTFAVALPDVSDFISLIGSGASSALALIFPPLLHMMVSLKSEGLPCRSSKFFSSMSKQIASIAKDVLIMILGIIGLVLGMYASMDALVQFDFEGNSDKPNTCANFSPH